jgi:hypothetical protein
LPSISQVSLAKRDSELGSKELHRVPRILVQQLHLHMVAAHCQLAYTENSINMDDRA